MGRLTHRHHIIPRHEGGSDDPLNLVELTVTQHAMWHFAEWKRKGKWQDFCAWQALAGYLTMDEAAKLAKEEGQKKATRNAAIANTGRRHSPETIEKMRKAALSRPPMSEEVKLRISKNRTGKGVGRVLSEETRMKIGDRHRGKKKPPESEETRRRKSEAQKKRWATMGRQRPG